VKVQSRLDQDYPGSSMLSWLAHDVWYQPEILALQPEMMPEDEASETFVTDCVRGATFPRSFPTWEAVGKIIAQSGCY
jgi:hypothetical protein